MHRKSDSLRRFTGNVEDFASWSQHVIDHMTKVHSHWKYTLNWLATTDFSLSFANLRGQVLGPFNEDSIDLAIKFEQVLVDWLPEKLYLRRDQLAGGKSESGNGFTMWRRLHKDHVGDGEILEYAGTTVLREYGQCKKLADVANHIDGWYELFDLYGKELENAHKTTRGMFLDIIPQELRTEILKEPKLNLAGHRALATWCRSRVMVLTSEKLADLKKKELTSKARRGINAILPPGEETDDTKEDASELNDLKSKVDTLLLQINAISKPPAKVGDRPPRKPNRSRSPSANRKSLIDWPPGKCFHCGGEHSRDKCEKFAKMMKDANVGKPKDQWKPPPDYKSAIGKARDAARIAQGIPLKPKAKAKAAVRRKVNSVIENEDIDTASDSEFSESEGRRSCQALTRFRSVTRSKAHSHTCADPTFVKSFCALNRFEGLETSQEYDLAAMNLWNARVRENQSQGARKKLRAANFDPELARTTKFIEGNRRPKSETIVVQCVKDLDKISEIVKPLPEDRKGLTKIFDKVSRISLDADERLVMVDSGSFCHAISPETLPNHEVTALSKHENNQDAESACGGIMKRLGRIKTQGLVDGISLNVRWNAMNVKVPILSVRKLVRDNHNVWFEKHGGYILNLNTGEKIPFFEFQGVYYLKMKMLPPDFPSSQLCSDQPLFARQGA